MKPKTLIKIFLISFFVLVGFFCLAKSSLAAATYYVSPTGSGTVCSSAQPCTLATGLGKSLVGDDSLILKDGTYTGTSLTVPWSGTEGHPITIKAENDGMAVIDGSGSVRSCYIANKHYINLEGVRCTNSSDNVVFVSGSDHINIRRVSGSIAGIGNNAIFLISYNSETMTQSSFVLVEDSFAYGRGRKLFQIATSNNITFRRNYGLFSETSDIGNPVMEGLEVYPGNDNLIENNIITLNPAGTGNPTAFKISRNTWSSNADRNKFYGNIAYNLNTYAFQVFSAGKIVEDNEFYNNVGINVSEGIENAGSENMTIMNTNIINHTLASSGSFSVAEPSGYTPDVGWIITTNIKNSVALDSAYRGLYVEPAAHIGTQIHEYNLYWDIDYTTCNIGCNVSEYNETLEPNYNTTVYGKGAYLMVPSALKGKGENGADIGAKVLYRYQDGVLTNVPLWPWPMEDRIKNEIGVSVTWEANGGLWKTLDGVYSQGDIIPPSPPTGLTVQ